MAEEMSVREQIEAVRRKYDVLIENEEYRLETERLPDKERQKIKGRLYELQEEERRIIKDIENGRGNLRKDGWSNCPRCGSNRVKQKGRIDHMFKIWLGGFLLTLLGLIIWPLIVVGILVMVISPIGLIGVKMNVCRDCKNEWMANKA